jgi:hypothetical protein
MTDSRDSASNYLGVYDSVGESSTELLLQPRSSRRHVMSQAWLGLIIFEIMFLPMLTIVPTVCLMATLLGLLSMYAPALQNHQITHGVIYLLWSCCFAAIVYLTWKAMCDVGYKTFIFDRIQQQLVINIANIVGGNSARIIPFDRIEDAEFQERDDDGMSVDVFLTLKERKIGRSVRKERIILSKFSSEEYRTVTNLTLREDHQELLLLVRTALGFSTNAILFKLKQNPPIPTEAELKQEKEQARLAAQKQIETLTKAIFAGKQEKQDRLEKLREQTMKFPEDPQIWQDFALQLAMQRNPPKAEIIDAYRQAEALYLDREDTEAARAMAQTIEGIK